MKYALINGILLDGTETMQPRPGLGIIIKPLRLPGHRLADKGQPRRLPLQGIEPQRHRPGPLERTQIFLIFIAQLGAHPG